MLFLSSCTTSYSNLDIQEKTDNENKNSITESSNKDFIYNKQITSDNTEENNKDYIDNSNNLEKEEQQIKYEELEVHYIGNKNTKKFHSLDCYNLPKLENQIEFESPEQAIKEGYSPCKNCNPK